MRDLITAINEVRTLCNEQDAAFFDNDTLKLWLWEGANHFALSGQLLQLPYQFSTQALHNGDMQQEYALPMDEGDILRVVYNDGVTLEPLEEIDIDQVQIGSYNTGSRPTHYYKKLNTACFTNMLSTGALEILNVNPKISDEFKYVIGLWPTPPEEDHVVTCTIAMPHPPLRDNLSKILIPFTYQRGVVAYATFMAKSKDLAYGEGKFWQDIFSQLLDLCEERALSQARKGHGKVKRRGSGTDRHFMGHNVIPTDTGMMGY